MVFSRQARHASPLPEAEVFAAYRSARRRLVVLCVGGTFLPSSASTVSYAISALITYDLGFDYIRSRLLLHTISAISQANDDVPLSPAQQTILMRLLRDPANTVVLASGRHAMRSGAESTSLIKSSSPPCEHSRI